MAIRIAIVGAGSQSFGPSTIQDILLSDVLTDAGVELVLMDVIPEHLPAREEYAIELADKLGRKVRVSATCDLDQALKGTDYVVAAVEVNRWLHWSQDFHVPRRYGFMQVYGENGGPGGLFHALRNMGPMLHVARRMEELCPDAVLLNFTNPESKLCQAISTLSTVRTFGLCHGWLDGRHALVALLGIPDGDLETSACGMNHFTWIQTIRRRSTGEDLYPLLRERERKADPIAHWDELALCRVCLRVFGLWPSPAASHVGEYIRWAGEFLATSVMQYYYDPLDGHPWETGRVPQFISTLTRGLVDRPLFPDEAPAESGAPTERPLKPSGELTVPIIEGLACGVKHKLGAVVVPNRGGIVPGMDEDTVIEAPATVDAAGLRPEKMAPLPEAVTAMLRLQGSIQRLLVEAYAEESRRKLLQALLLDPTAHSYRNAVVLIDEMCELQKDLLPELSW